MKKTLFFLIFLAITSCIPKSEINRTFRKKIIIDHSYVFNSDQKNFPVFFNLTEPSQKSVSNGGHVSQSGGEDIFFTVPDGKKRLPHEIVHYDPENGELKAWIRIPVLYCRKDTEFFMYYGNPDHVSPQNTKAVWDKHYVLVEHLNEAADPSISIPHAESFTFTDEITVEAWVYSDTYQPEVIKPLVSKWKQLTSFDAFDAYDAGSTDGLTCFGYLGAVFDGRYVYFSPMVYERGKAHGRVLRYDTHGGFNDPKSYSAYDAGNTADLATKGYYGAVFDGRYVYFVPRKDYIVNHSKVLRYDTHGDFKNSKSWDACDVGEEHTQQGAAFDGRYIYFSPGYKGDPNAEDEYSGRVIRFDTGADFKDPSSWKSHDASNTSGLNTVCFDGAGFDGRYVYFAPLLFGAVLRYDTKSDFTGKKSWRAFDAKRIDMEMCVGTVFDGRYVYFVPYYNSNVVRLDTHGDFDDIHSWQSRDVGNISGLNTGGFDGGFFDGRYVYFVPFVSPGDEGVLHRNKKYVFHSNFLRYDTLGEFDEPESWDAYDASQTGSLETIGYNAGAYDGRYFYLAPWRNGNDGTIGLHGRIQRYDTVGNQGSFSLRYCDYGSNGGLNGAVYGPGFVVNTEKGSVSVAAHKALLPGRHHIAGVYNGRSIKLFVDGVLIAERPGSGSIQTNDTDVVIGSLLQNAARFCGSIGEVRISNTARNDDWLKTEYHNLINPSGFVRIGEGKTVIF